MTDDEITKLGPAFAGYLRGYRDGFLQDRTATHFDNYCRGLLSDLPRKSVEPIALACGTAVRTLQEFLTTADWDHEKLQRRLIQAVEQMPADDLGTIGVIDETSCLKKGGKTPGVQRQYLGCVGKIDNGLVTVHLGGGRQGQLSGAPGRRGVPAREMGAGSQAVPEGRDPRCGAVPHQLADRL